MHFGCGGNLWLLALTSSAKIFGAYPRVTFDKRQMTCIYETHGSIYFVHVWDAQPSMISQRLITYVYGAQHTSRVVIQNIQPKQKREAN
jgi:hypothetical protein